MVLFSRSRVWKERDQTKCGCDWSWYSINIRYHKFNSINILCVGQFNLVSVYIRRNSQQGKHFDCLLSRGMMEKDRQVVMLSLRWLDHWKIWQKYKITGSLSPTLIQLTAVVSRTLWFFKEDSNVSVIHKFSTRNGIAFRIKIWCTCDSWIKENNCDNLKTKQSGN